MIFVKMLAAFFLTLAPFSIGWLMGYKRGFWQCFASKDKPVAVVTTMGPGSYFFLVFSIIAFCLAMVTIGYVAGVSAMRTDWEKCWEKVHVYS